MTLPTDHRVREALALAGCKTDPPKTDRVRANGRIRPCRLYTVRKSNPARMITIAVPTDVIRNHEARLCARKLAAAIVRHALERLAAAAAAPASETEEASK